MTKRVMAAAAGLGLSGVCVGQLCAPQWSAVGDNLGGSYVTSLTMHDDGGGPQLYAAGSVTVDGQPAYVARFDGKQWSSLPIPLSGSLIALSLTSFDDGAGPALWLAGGFTFGGQACVARWRGGQWEPAGAGITSASAWPESMVFQEFRGSLYVGGVIVDEMKGVARWDGTRWHSVGGGFGGLTHLETVTINDMAVFQDELYVAGDFWGAGPNPNIKGLARYDGVAWQAVGTFSSIGGPRRLDAFHSGPLRGVVAAEFGNAVRRWDGTTWTTTGCYATGGPDPSKIWASDTVQLRGRDGVFYGGSFSHWTTNVSSRLGMIDGPSCARVGAGPDNAVQVVLSAGEDTVYIGGWFHSVGGVTTNLVARGELCGACYPDCNSDGALNLSDFGCFTTKFALGDLYSDCNGDGLLQLSDFGCFQTKFLLGCN